MTYVWVGDPGRGDVPYADGLYQAPRDNPWESAQGVLPNSWVLPASGSPLSASGNAPQAYRPQAGTNNMSSIVGLAIAAAVVVGVLALKGKR